MSNRRFVDMNTNYKTRNGLDVIIDQILSYGPTFPVKGRVFEDGEWKTMEWTIEGTKNYMKQSSEYDIIFDSMPKSKRKKKSSQPEIESRIKQRFVSWAKDRNDVFLCPIVHLHGEVIRKAHAIVFQRNIDNDSNITVQDLLNEIASEVATSEINKRFEALLRSKQQSRQEHSLSKTKTNG